MRILAIAAHPDDLEQLCGGTLARYTREGHTVVMCHVSAGDRGSYRHTSAEIAAIRNDEAATAATLIGAEHVSLGLSDGEVNAADPAQRRLVVDLVRTARPDVIITHAPDDYMPDHNEVAALAQDMSFIASLPLFETDHPVHAQVPALFHMDTLAGLGTQPCEYVDVSEVIDTKLDMLCCHGSQLSWLKEHDGVDIVEQTRVAGAYRGFQAGVRYAEGFRPSLRWLRVRTRRLLP